MFLSKAENYFVKIKTALLVKILIFYNKKQCTNCTLIRGMGEFVILCICEVGIRAWDRNGFAPAGISQSMFFI